MSLPGFDLGGLLGGIGNGIGNLFSGVVGSFEAMLRGAAATAAGAGLVGVVLIAAALVVGWWVISRR